MKLVVAIVQQRDRTKIGDELVKAGFKYTVFASQGGFLGQSSATFLVGVDPEDVSVVVKLVQSYCQSREQLVNIAPFDLPNPGSLIPSAVNVPVGGAVVFVLDVSEFHQI